MALGPSTLALKLTVLEDEIRIATIVGSLMCARRLEYQMSQYSLAVPA